MDIMERRPPTPICKSFMACRQVIHDRLSGDYVVIAPAHQLVAPTYPLVANLAFFARCSSVNGTYQLELQLQDLEGNIIWRNLFPNPLQDDDPLRVAYLALLNQGIYFPQPGMYEFVLLANGEELIRDTFWARLPQPDPTT